MRKNGKIQRVVMGILATMLVASLLLAITSLVAFAEPLTPLADDPGDGGCDPNWCCTQECRLIGCYPNACGGTTCYCRCYYYNGCGQLVDVGQLHICGTPTCAASIER
jgi:hypothetical protein